MEAAWLGELNAKACPDSSQWRIAPAVMRTAPQPMHIMGLIRFSGLNARAERSFATIFNEPERRVVRPLTANGRSIAAAEPPN
jgi:hypothetical protein